MNATPHRARSSQRPHGAAEDAGRHSTGLLAVGLTGIVVLFLSPYVTLFPFVGSFPAEDVREHLPRSYFAGALCLPEQGDPATQRGSAPPPPALTVEQGLAPVPRGILESSSSLYFSERTGEIVALDRVEQGDESTLWMLEAQRSVSRPHLISFLDESRRYYARCEAPIIDRGITEGYWAAKGSSVLHHWVHLYEGGLGGSVRAQYGYAIPRSVRAILEWSSSLGPTSFVRLSWVVFAACGLAYFAIFLHLFRDHPWLARAALLLKVFFFTRVGGFALLLAPGYHWHRELVLVAVPAILLAAASKWSVVGSRRGWPSLVAAGAGLSVCALIEPMFFMVAGFSAVVALTWGNYAAIADYARANRRRVLVLVILAAAVVGVVALQSGSLAYVTQKLRGDDLVVPTAKYASRTLAVCAAAVGFLLVLRGRPHDVLQGYVALVAMSSSLYYFVTPDAFHFYKFSEYAVPFGVALAGFVVDRCGDWVRSHLALPRSWVAGGAAVGFVALAAMTTGNLRATPSQWERRIEDSFGAPYFRAASFTINGRVIRANLSERLAEHLRAFPASTPFDFMVSPFDKYVTFLYDRTNGFRAPDLLGWLQSQGKLEGALRRTAGSDRPVLVLLDESTLDVDARLGIKGSHPVLGPIHLASKINLKARLRASELAAELMARCEVDVSHGATKGWRLLRCGRDR